MNTQLIYYINFLQSKAVFDMIFDKIRLIDPVKNEVQPLGLISIEDPATHCYEFWCKKKICDNCISMRALKQKSIFFKLETRQDRIFSIISVPVDMCDRIAVLELMKDVSSSLIVEDLKMDDNEIINMVGNINQLQIRDALTGLYNRRYIDERLPADIMNSHMDITPLTVVMADIDRFKLVNDSYGHVAGDAVIKQFGNLLEENIPKDKGWVGRYGGEEFLIVLSNTDKAEAENITEKLRAGIEKNEFVYSDKAIRVTSSFGAVTLVTNRDMSVEAVIESADKNLYRAKSSGRNRVVAEEL